MQIYRFLRIELRASSSSLLIYLWVNLLYSINKFLFGVVYFVWRSIEIFLALRLYRREERWLMHSGHRIHNQKTVVKASGSLICLTVGWQEDVSIVAEFWPEWIIVQVKIYSCTLECWVLACAWLPLTVIVFLARATTAKLTVGEKIQQGCHVIDGFVVGGRLSNDGEEPRKSLVYERLHSIMHLETSRETSFHHAPWDFPRDFIPSHTISVVSSIFSTVTFIRMFDSKPSNNELEPSR